jgi:hypothetical protein
LGFHPLAVADAENFGQRPKIDAYDDVTLMMPWGWTPAVGDEQVRRIRERSLAQGPGPGQPARVFTGATGRPERDRRSERKPEDWSHG